ncbi:MAG: 2-C-methyl-D-erythritol 4-phosphate cytidylyltransferase [bacterium]|jgi:2-C-methyl-D-erythritol 4-phosphate cytidylyltransferase
MIFGIIVAAGKSERMGADVDKAFLSLGTRPVLMYSLQAFEQCPLIDGVILVVRKDRLDAARGMIQMFGFSKVRKVVAGGASRQLSVMLGMAELKDDVKIVAVHDGARPCVTPALIQDTILSAKRQGTGVAAVKVTDTIKEVDRGTLVSRTVDRSKLWAVQTPQTFRVDWLNKAYANAKKKKLTVTDEASAVEALGEQVHLVPAPSTNIKITTPADLALASMILKV